MHLVNVSGGLGSAMSWFRVVERYGLNNVVARWASPELEGDDTREFVNEVHAIIGGRLDRLTTHQDQWDLFMERGMLYAPKSIGGGCTASYWLKKKLLSNHSLSFHRPTVHVGFSLDEDDRIEKLRANPDPGIGGYEFPLCWKPALSACGVRNELERRGVSVFPKAYSEGMPHNNCKRGCIRGGIRYWSLLWKDDLMEYLYHESREQDFLAMLRSRGRKEVTILRDRRGGATKNFSLMQLRLELESGVRFADDSWRVPCVCS